MRRPAKERSGRGADGRKDGWRRGRRDLCEARGYCRNNQGRHQVHCHRREKETGRSPAHWSLLGTVDKQGAFPKVVQGSQLCVGPLVRTHTKEISLQLLVKAVARVR